jgi:flagellar secretion chaperone FliS
MWNQPHTAYAESRILTADPMELVRLMYQGAIAEVRSARAHLQTRDIPARSRCVSKACAILTELTVALDRKSGGQYAERLGELYAYMMRRLTEANFQQREEPLAEVQNLLSTLLDGWEGAQRQLAAQTMQTTDSRRADVPGSFDGGTWARPDQASYTPQAWSF